MAIVNFWYNT